MKSKQRWGWGKLQLVICCRTGYPHPVPKFCSRFQIWVISTRFSMTGQNSISYGPWLHLFIHLSQYSLVFLADRTNGRAYATVLRLSVCPSVCPSVCRLSVTLCIVAKRCVLEQKLLLRTYRKSYMRNRLVPK